MNERHLRLISALFLGYIVGCTHMATAAAVNFGSVRVGSHKTANVNVTVPGTAKWRTVTVRTGGAENLDFTEAGKVHCRTRAAHDGDRVCIVKVTFKPLYGGPRHGGVTFADIGGNAIGTTYIYGTGLGSEVASLPGPRITISGIHQPNGLAVDEQRDLYVTDYDSGEVYKETLLSGGGYSLNTIAKGLFGVRAVAVDGNGDVFVNGIGMYIIMHTLQGGGSYTQRRIGNSVAAIGGLAVDGRGNVYATDYNSGRIFEESPSSNGTYTQTLLVSGLKGPTGIAADKDGSLYIAAEDRVFKETLFEGQYIQTLIKGAFRAAQGVALDGNGDLYVSDYSTGRVYKESVSAGGYVESLQATDVGGNYVAVDDVGNLYVSDLGQGVIYRLPAGLAVRSPTLGRAPSKVRLGEIK